MIRVVLGVVCIAGIVCLMNCTSSDEPSQAEQEIRQYDLTGKPYQLDTGLVSRSICFENVTGAPGEGGKASNYLGVGRKGSPAKSLPADSLFTLCDIDGPGCINHIWLTLGPRDQEALRTLVVRAYWEGQDHPSIECPLGDFMGFAHGKVMPYYSAVHSCGRNAGMNIWLPMPFIDHARITLTNDGDRPITIFYQIDYTLGNSLSGDAGRLHCCFRRENPTTLTEDFTILPKRTGKGRYIGAVLGIRYEDKHWWGEGEIKIYMDGDTAFPTICGTGSEDYVCLSYGMQQTPFLYNGCSLNDEERGFVSMYRWHLPDPVYWEEDVRITIQQIGWSRELRDEKNEPLYERQDDWSAAAFWYEPVPSAPLAAMSGLAARTADLYKDVD